MQQIRIKTNQNLNFKVNPEYRDYGLILIQINDVKKNIEIMAMEKSLYAQVIKFRQKDLKFDAADKNKNESKFKFQGQSRRS